MKILGIACGIATVGWGLLDLSPSSLTIAAAGVWSFDTPETPKDATPLSAVRGRHRGQRRVINRRRLRMNAIRQLFHAANLLAHANSDALSRPGSSPWDLRAAAFARALTGPELAIALGHIASHRGFKSNRKHAREANEADETSRMKKAIAANQEALQRHRTVGLMFANEPAFQDRKHNRGGDFSRSVLRADLEHEVRQIFAEQRRRHSPFATTELEAEFCRVAFTQRPTQDSEHLVGACLFEPTEKRTARRGYAFEMFRLLSRLANLTLSQDGRQFRLTAGMIRRLTEDFGATKRISYRSIRERLAFSDSVSFVGIGPKDEQNDVAARQGNAAEGTFALRQVAGPQAWRWLMDRPELRDRIAELLTFRNDPASIRAGLLQAGGLTDPLFDAIMQGVEEGAFSQFSGVGHLSAKAVRNLLPALRRGAGYHAACVAAGYDPDAAARVSLADIRNGVTRKAITEALKQIRAITRVHGRPDAIHVGLMRDVGKSAEERDAITRGIEARTRKREVVRGELEALLGRSTEGGELLRYELWKEQGGRCLYTDTYIDPAWLAAADNTVMVGHILPWSRFGDDSFPNKTLCLVSAGQAKQDRTPWEWFAAQGLDWAAFTARVEACADMKPFKQHGHYLRKNAAEVEEAFRNRHLSDTRYIARLLRLYLDQTYPGVNVRARASQLTAKLRRAWGLGDLKHDEDGKRVSDIRHRALDAIVLATITERMLEDLMHAAREAERQGSSRGFDFRLVEPPAEGFRDIVREVIAGIFAARAERRRVTGELHAATIKRVRTIDDKTTVFERKPVERLTLADLDEIPTPAPYGNAGDPAKLRDAMVNTLRTWIEQGRPKDSPPRSPKGDLIRKVRIATRQDVRVAVRGGTADRGEIVRVDVFSKPARGGAPRYHLVPVYPHQIADRDGYPTPPDRAVSAGVPESGWTLMDGAAEFLFSLFPHSLVDVVKPDGEVIRGYFKGVDRATGAIAIGLAEDMQAKPIRVGPRTLLQFDKLKVDRLGRITRVKREVRTWRGVACT